MTFICVNEVIYFFIRGGEVVEGGGSLFISSGDFVQGKGITENKYSFILAQRPD